ncbi:uncharacterized protein VICG_01795 [Vittaforma corneae ATCC 50505]|uniref:Uncharacterized protein n=1 Tax=Vittaforma corneae (strain ATCC 50505) TaxID=993615 RepID=L2GK24_VITCO|nr:uncharacterized protein VICG_01795 [Vittaforma corneae ATCC 50505]ELA41196.1 hypothetical protein VICG_01795 [Vittaforma corneae ATCC 50505]
MIYALLYILTVLAQSGNPTKPTTSSVSASVSSVSSKQNGSNTSSASKSESKASSSVPSSVSASKIVSSSTICVECYNKIKTKDCQPCECKCGDGTKYTFSQPEKNSQCPRNPENVPCACKDDLGHIKEDATYVKGVTKGNSCVSD